MSKNKRIISLCSPYSLHGERHFNTKFTNQDIKNIIELRIANISVAEIAKKYNVSNNTIYRILNNTSWKHIAKQEIPYKRNISGIKGVYFLKNINKWIAMKMVNGKFYRSSVCNSKDGAIQERKKLDLINL